MSQVTIYLPEGLAKQLKARSRRERKSLSALMAELAQGPARRGTWPPGFFDLFGCWEGDFPAIDDPPPEDEAGL